MPKPFEGEEDALMKMTRLTPCTQLKYQNSSKFELCFEGESVGAVLALKICVSPKPNYKELTDSLWVQVSIKFTSGTHMSRY